MIKGCKHYFSLFGMMLCTANHMLQKFFNSIKAQIEKSIDIAMDYSFIVEKYIVQKNKIYQK